HGIVGSAYLVHLNEALIHAGLAVREAGGEISPRRSRVLYHPANNGSLHVNRDLLAAGAGSRSQGGLLLREAMAALSAIRPPDPSAPPVVAGFLDQQGRRLTPAKVGERDDLAYVALSDGYQPSAVADGGAVVRAMAKSAAHVINTG